MVQFPSQDVHETEITAEPELTSEQKEPEIIAQKELSDAEPQIPSKPKEITDKQPKDLKITGLSTLQQYVHDNIAKTLIGPPEPGHTTFTIKLKENTVSGFYQIPTETKSLKELGPVLLTKTKELLKILKERDFKKDLKNLKNIPTVLKKTPSKINIDTIKNLPKKIRALFSSD